MDKFVTGELIDADHAEVICDALNDRDSDKTKVTGKTENVLLIVDGAPGISLEAIHAALQKNPERITTFAGAKVSARAILL